MRSREREKHSGEVTWAAYMPHDAEKAPSDFGKAQDLDQLLRKVRIRALPVRALVAVSLEISYQSMASEISDAFDEIVSPDARAALSCGLGLPLLQWPHVGKELWEP